MDLYRNEHLGDTEVTSKPQNATTTGLGMHLSLTDRKKVHYCGYPDIRKSK